MMDIRAVKVLSEANDGHSITYEVRMSDDFIETVRATFLLINFQSPYQFSILLATNFQPQHSSCRPSDISSSNNTSSSTSQAARRSSKGTRPTSWTGRPKTCQLADRALAPPGFATPQARTTRPRKKRTNQIMTATRPPRKAVDARSANRQSAVADAPKPPRSSSPLEKKAWRKRLRTTGKSLASSCA
jgi:hypothetical protein